MAARLVTVFVPDPDAESALALARRHARRIWIRPVVGEMESLLCVVQGRYVERLLDELEDAFGDRPDFCVIVSPIEALVPPLLETPETARPLKPDARPQTRLEAFFTRDRLSTEELYEDINSAVRLTPSFLVTVLSSAVIAGLGMRSGQTAIVIGAMVIAPFLGPSIGLAMAATVGDARLARRATLALGVGVCLVLAFMSVVGAMIEVDPTVPELRNRANVSLADIVLALASGSAGVLAFSRGASVSLVGVMIAVALVPPLSAAGLFLGSGNPYLALNAAFLFATNLVCINVAGIATFLAQGLPPKSWRITAGVLVIWVGLLLLLSVALVARFGIGFTAL